MIHVVSKPEKISDTLRHVSNWPVSSYYDMSFWADVNLIGQLHFISCIWCEGNSKYTRLCVTTKNNIVWIAALALTNFVNNVFVFVFLSNSSLLQILFLTCVGLLFIIPVYSVFCKRCHSTLGWIESNICWTSIQTSSRLTNPTHYLYLKQLLCKI